MRTPIETLLAEHAVTGASADSLACRCDGRWRHAADYREHVADALLPLIRLAQAGALEQFAAQVRSDWAPDSCPWVGAVDDRAAAYRVGEGESDGN